MPINFNNIQTTRKRPHKKANGGPLGNMLPEVVITAKYPHEQRVIDTMNAFDAEFMNRLRNNDRRAIHNQDGSYSTHVLGSADNIVFPAIQDVNGELKDYRGLPWQSILNKAIQNNDYIEFPTEGDARYFGEHYKQYFPEYFDNQYAEGGKLNAPNYWDDLSLSEKNDVMAAAVRNGITNLHDIRDKWNEFADEGEGNNTEDSAEDHMYYTGGPVMQWDNNILLNPMQQQLMQSHPLEATVTADGGHLFKKGGKENLANTRARQAIGYFMNKGLTKAQASGLVGNLMRESEGLNPAAESPYSHTYGLAQWLGPRRKELFKRYGSHPTFNQQLDYIWSELNTTHRKGLQKLQSSKTTDDAARNAFGYYEFSGGPEAAIAAMNGSGRNTKWKNPDGYSAMMKGVNNARKLMGQSPLSYSSYDYSDSPSFSDMLGTPRRKPLTFEESMQSTAINYEVPKVVLPMPEDSKPEPSPTMSAADKLDHFNALMSLLGMESPLPSATSYLQGILGSKPNNPDGSLFGTLSLLSGNTFAEGGKEDNSKGNENTIIHPFTWDRPFTYNGKQYPTAISVDNNTGLPMQTFADNSGNVFTMDGDTAVPATFVHDIEGPTVLYSKTLHKQVPVNDNGSIDYSKLSFMDNYRLANNLLEQRGEQSAYDPNGFMDFMNAVTLGLGNRFSVSQNARLVKDTYDAATGNKSWGDVVNSAILGNEGIFENPYANMALDIVAPVAMEEAPNLYKLTKLNKIGYTGVPHRQIFLGKDRQTPLLDFNGNPVNMDENFPKTYREHTIWTADDPDYSYSFIEGEGDKVYDVYTNPKKLNILHTSKPSNSENVRWNLLPYKMNGNKVEFADQLVKENKGFPALSREVALRDKMPSGGYPKVSSSTTIYKDAENDPRILDPSHYPSAVKTDDIVRFSRNKGYDATGFNRIYDGGIKINNEYYDYPINEIVLNPGVDSYVLPHGMPKYKLLQQMESTSYLSPLVLWGISE